MKRILRVLLVLLVIIVILLGTAAGFGVYTVRRMLPQTSGTLTLPGLDGKVEILRDAAGVPHIYATTARDLFFAQGVVHAQDRWWQMEFSRHTALGRISELTGFNERVRRNDIFIRTLGWNRSAEQDLKAAPAEDLAILQAYADGVNAYTAGKSGADLAVEYSMLGLRGVSIPIEAWQPLHSVAWSNAMAWNLSGNMDEELDIAKFAQTFSADADSMMKYLWPDYPFDKNPTIVRREDLPVEAQPAASMPSRAALIAPGTDLSKVSTRLIGGATLDDLDWLKPDVGLGSNNWVIGGARTESGKPILANDPHLSIQMPSIWYQVGLHCVTVSATCPYDVVGFSFAGVPGVVIGHNSRIAWGVTNVNPDTQDLYIVKVDPANPDRYELDGILQDMQIVTETIKYGDGKPDETIKVRITRWGPIVTDTPFYSDQKQPLAVRWAALEQPKRLLSSALAINRATDWQTFRQALTMWDSPSQNFVFADIDGNIGYQMPGRIVIRAAGHSGLTPVDGSTTKYDWKGYIPFEYLPRVYNPERGYISTANQAVVPLDYYAQLADKIGDQFGRDSNYVISYYWAYGFRGKRIVDLIEATPKHTPDSVAAIQGDNLNAAAAAVLPQTLDQDFGVDVPAEVVAWMKSWDYQNHMSSGQAALFEVFWLQLVKSLWGDQLGYTPNNPGGVLISAVAGLLEAPDNVWWDDVTTASVTETRDEILRRAFVAGYKEAQARLGANYKTWTWGALHTAAFVSTPLGASGISLIEDFVNGGPVAASGGSEIVNATGYGLSGDSFAVRSIPSMRMIVNVAALDQSRWIHSTGQSGHPMSAHYRDQTDRWRLIQYVPMLFSRVEIDKAAVERLTLEPKR